MSDRIQFTKTCERPLGLGGQLFIEGMEEFPIYFIRFETERDLSRWWGCHSTAIGRGRPAFHEGWYAVHLEVSYYQGTCEGRVLELRPAAPALREYRRLIDQLSSMEADLDELAMAEVARESL